MKNPLSSGKKVLLVLLLIAMFSPSNVSAQVLDQQINALLANNCAGLGTGGFGNFNGAGLGPNLNAICQPPQTSSAVSSGGGAASVQGSTVSILNRVLLGRLEELRQEGQEEGRQPSSMQFNPLGILSMASLGNVNVNSPFYAASTAGGSSSSFITSNQSRWKGLGFFATGRVESLNRDVTRFQDGYNSTILGFSAGVDYRVSKTVVAGMLGNFSNTGGDWRGGGTFSTNSYGWLAFAHILPTERTFIQVTGGYTRNNYLVNRLATATVTVNGIPPTRTINSFASSNSNGDVANASVLAGYDHPFGRFTIGPRAGVYYTRTHIGSYAENGGGGIGLAYGNQDIDSLQSTFGLFGSAAYSTRFGVLVHQVSADYVHEFMNHQRQIDVRFTEDLRADPTRFTFQNESPARDYGNISTGLVMALPNGWQPFVNFRAMVGNEQFTNYAGMLGLRIAL
ncbi:MAG: autotransporter outer membrane beta-barrel domain-containing protein [Nitrospira sp.]|nr:autotransporter outer membrane beta-barrel domain-containing protein [Nitrospira sp.]